MRCQVDRASSSSLRRSTSTGSLSWREMAAGDGGDSFKTLRDPWHISQVNEEDFLLTKVQVEQCHVPGSTTAFATGDRRPKSVMT